MKAIMCDVCKQPIPDYLTQYYSRRMRWYHLVFDWSAPNNENSLDVCNKCWVGFEDYMKSKMQKGADNHD